MKVLTIFLLGLLVTLLGCSSLISMSSNRMSYNNFEGLNVGVVTAEQVKQIFGNPDKAYYLGKENRIVEKSERLHGFMKLKN